MPIRGSGVRHLFSNKISIAVPGNIAKQLSALAFCARVERDEEYLRRDPDLKSTIRRLNQQEPLGSALNGAKKSLRGIRSSIHEGTSS